MEDSPWELQKKAELFMQLYEESVHAPTKWERLANFLFEVYGNGLIDRLHKEAQLRSEVELDVQAVRRQNDEMSLQLSQVDTTVNNVAKERDNIKMELDRLKKIHSTFACPQTPLSQMHLPCHSSGIKSMNEEHEVPRADGQVKQNPSPFFGETSLNRVDGCILNENGARKAVWEAIGMPLPGFSRAPIDQHEDGATTPPQSENPRSTETNTPPQESSLLGNIPYSSAPCIRTPKNTLRPSRSGPQPMRSLNCQGKPHCKLCLPELVSFGDLIYIFLCHLTIK